MKIAILSPHFPPKLSGLSHYSKHFAQELLNQNHSVDIITKEKDENLNSFNIYPIIKKGDFLDFYKIYKKLKKDKNEHLLIQYVPYMYGKIGINFFLPFFALTLRCFSKIKISIMFHEINYPLEKSVKSIILYSSHKTMAFLLMISAHNIFASTSRMIKILSFINIFRKKISLLEVGSNITKFTYSDEDKTSLLEKYSIPQEKIKLVLFGGFHPSKKMDLIINTLLSSDLEQKDMIIIHIGVDLKDVNTFLKRNISSDLYKAIGKISDKDVSILLQESDALITYFTDGVSTRRGSLIAGLVNDISCFSTTGASTDKLFINDQQITLAPTKEKLYTQDLLKFLDQYRFQEKSQNDKDGDLASYFSWNKIVKKYLKIIMH